MTGITLFQHHNNIWGVSKGGLRRLCKAKSRVRFSYPPPYIMFTDKLKLANITESEYDIWVQQMANPKFYDHLYRHSVVIWPHIMTCGDQMQKQLNDLLPEFINNYNNIKDSTWPNIHSYSDFKALPQHIIHECLTHGISINRWRNSIVQRLRQSVDDQRALMLIPVIKLIMENLEYIRNQHVLEFNASNGKLSGTMLHCDCQSLTVFETAPQMLYLKHNLSKHFDSNVTYCDPHTHTQSLQTVDTILIPTKSSNIFNSLTVQDFVNIAIKYKPKHVIIEYNRSINNQPNDIDTHEIVGYNIIKKSQWQFHIDEYKIDKELCIFEHTN